jgi:two-component system cell cycle sensor histidine kinase/response regulator CckA
MLPRLIGEDIELVFAPGQKLGKVKTDPGQIEQFLLNLVANARDAMPKGGKLVVQSSSVRLDDACIQKHSIVPPGECSADGHRLGAGNRTRALATYFRAFLHYLKRKGKGTGLGLATVYGIVKQNSGFVWVYSEAGLGTTKIYLPRARQAKLVLQTSLPVEVSPRGCETLAAGGR